MITTRRGRAKKRRAEEEEPEADPTEALVRTTAALKDAHAAARKAEKNVLAKETEAAALKAERDALATRCAFLESESADAQKAVQSAQAEKTAAAGAAQLELEKANQARRKAEAKQQADRGSLDAALCRVAALKRDLEIAEAKAQDIPEPPPAPTGSVLDALEIKPSVEKLAEDAQNALSQATAARADLAKERAVSTKLRAEVDQARRDAKGAALEREKVRALEAQIKVLSEQDAEDSKIRAERDALVAERREWATRFRGLVDSDDDTNVARQALDLLKVTIDAKTRADCDAADSKALAKKHEQSLKQCEGRLATADAELRRLRTQLSRVDADKKAWEGERSLYIKETESLRRLAATYDNDADATLKKRISDLESQLEAAAKALRDSKPPASEPANEAPQAPSNDTEEFRIVHLVDNPAAAAAAKRAAAKKEEVQGGVDPATLHARLKERFREHLNWFRDAVYLLTGFKVDMQGLGEGHPQVRLRSMFAEREDDSLLFAWSDDGVNLLATPFADQLDERLFANLKFCNSVPAFLASVQLNLFERQTLFPG
jgi:mitotic spindle assembly checkpoint protein MAD1